MALVLYGHPFSFYTQKVLIALYENGTEFEFRLLDQGEGANLKEWMRRWPLNLMPLLVDGERQIVESSVIIEYLQLVSPGPVRLIPNDPMAALDVRFLDRFFDNYIMSPQQMAVAVALKRYPMEVEDARAIAGEKFEKAYGWLEKHLEGKEWAAGDHFMLADCAAAPSLFYADWTCDIPGKYPNVRAYRARLLKRPSFARCVEEARGFRHYFPLGAPDRD